MTFPLEPGLKDALNSVGQAYTAAEDILLWRIKDDRPSCAGVIASSILTLAACVLVGASWIVDRQDP